MLGLHPLGLCLLIGGFFSPFVFPQTVAAQAVGDCVALEFVTPGCPQCRAMDESIEESLRHGWAIRRVDLATDPFTAQRWRIHSTPTTLLVREGREVDRILGPVSFDELQRRMMAASSRVAPASHVATHGSAAPMGTSNPTSTSFSLQPVTKQPITKRSAPIPTPIEPESPQPLADPTEVARRATVRIRVDEPTSQAFGTGTIIHAHESEALVLTCGHLFRGLSGNPRISVELFDRGETVAYPANLIHFEAADKDIGLIAFQPDRPVSCAPISRNAQGLGEGVRVFSIGCDNGNAPSRRDSRVTKLNRYLGAPNIEVAGMPVQGRSGGGLFNETGELIGVCYAADHEWNEGLYTGLEIIHEQIAKLGLDSLHPSAPSAGVLADRTPSRPSKSMTLIVRDADGSQRELQIQDPSPALLQALEREGFAVVR
jgi:hypothetical protein